MPRDIVTSGAVRVDLRDLNSLYTSLRKIDRESADEFGRALSRAGESVAMAARGLAGWSSRIPAQVTVQRSRAKVTIKAGPGPKGHRGEAAAFENDGKPGTFRHPVFGNKNAWVSQNARPFLLPAVHANLERTATYIGLAVDNVFRRAGL